MPLYTYRIVIRAVRRNYSNGGTNDRGRSNTIQTRLTVLRVCLCIVHICVRATILIVLRYRKTLRRFVVSDAFGNVPSFFFAKVIEVAPSKVNVLTISFVNFRFSFG